MKGSMGYQTTTTWLKSSPSPFINLLAFILGIHLVILFINPIILLLGLRLVVGSLTRPLVERLTGKSCPMAKL